MVWPVILRVAFRRVHAVRFRLGDRHLG